MYFGRFGVRNDRFGLRDQVRRDKSVFRSYGSIERNAGYEKLAPDREIFRKFSDFFGVPERFLMFSEVSFSPIQSDSLRLALIQSHSIHHTKILLGGRKLLQNLQEIHYSGGHTQEIPK